MRNLTESTHRSALVPNKVARVSFRSILLVSNVSEIKFLIKV